MAYTRPLEDSEWKSLTMYQSILSRLLYIKLALTYHGTFSRVSMGSINKKKINIFSMTMTTKEGRFTYTENETQLWFFSDKKGQQFCFQLKCINSGIGALSLIDSDGTSLPMSDQFRLYNTRENELIRPFRDMFFIVGHQNYRLWYGEIPILTLTTVREHFIESFGTQCRRVYDTK